MGYSLAEVKTFKGKTHPYSRYLKKRGGAWYMYLFERNAFRKKRGWYKIKDLPKINFDRDGAGMN